MNQSAQRETRIDTQAPADEQNRVDAIIAPYAEMLGRAPGGLQMLGISPPVLEHYAGTIQYYMAHPRLSQPLLTLIRYLVSWRGECTYCIDLNESFLMNAGLDLDTIRACRADATQAPLDEREKDLLLVSLDAVDYPQRVTRDRIAALRAHGWSDRDIFDAVWHATLNRAFGHTAEAFGLPPDGYITA
jgi:alkylhydroperoxidase family enzyme